MFKFAAAAFITASASATEVADVLSMKSFTNSKYIASIFILLL